MNPVVVRDSDTVFGLSTDRVGRPDPPFVAVRRRIAGHYTADPFGLDAQLCDLVAPILDATTRVEIDGAEHLPASGGAVLVTNRGIGGLEPSALGAAVRKAVGRRVRFVGAPGTRGPGALLRRFGAIAASADDVRAALGAGNLVVVPLHSGVALPGRRAAAGALPLELLQTIMGAPVIPVAVRARGPIGTGLLGWRVTIGAAITPDPTIPVGDPLGAAELAEHIRTAIDRLD